MILIDTNVLIDIFEEDGPWTNWSRNIIARVQVSDGLFVNHVVVAELAGYFRDATNIETGLARMNIDVVPFNLQAAFRSGKAFRDYRRRGGERSSILADFLIAGHAASLGVPLITRDKRRIASYFPELTLITPETHSDG